MNIIINIFLLFLYLYGILGLSITNIYNNNMILHKFVILLCTFIFQFLLLLFEKVIWKCKVDLAEIAFNSFMTGLVSVVGYSFFTDIRFMKIFKPMPIKKSVYALFVVVAITVVVLIYKLFSLAMNANYQKCDKYE